MIELSDVHKNYKMGEYAVEALRGISLRIDDGDFVAIMGPSGSGKSTLLHVLGLLDVPSSGTLALDGRDASRLSDDELAILRRETIGFVFQDFSLLPRMTAEENVSLPLLYSGRKDDPAKARKLLARMNLGDRVLHRSNELSGGQQQRVAIARALANDPRLILADEPTGNLDSARKDEILATLKSLNEQGITIIVVTHEEEVARQAGRVIRMRDGVVQSDERVTPRPPVPPRGARPAGSVGAKLTAGELLEYFRQGFRSLRANKVRSSLSMLGILIGVAAVVAMLAVGRGAQNAIEAQMLTLGSNLLILSPAAGQAGGVSQEAGATRLTPDDARSLMEAVPEVSAAASIVAGRVQADFSDRNWNTQLVGATPGFERIHSLSPAAGRFFTDAENVSRARVAVVGRTVIEHLFGGKNPIGESIRLNRTSFQVIGILPEKGESGGTDQDDVVVVPLLTAMHRILGRNFVDTIHLQMRQAADTRRAQDAILQTILRRHHVPASKSADTFAVHDMAEIQAALTRESRTMSQLLAAIAAISLLVGGIGIMNIMLVSVTERTREIGLRKAIGARRREILEQFLAEAVVVSVIGGVLGIAFGALIATAFSALSGWETSVSAGAVVMSFLFSAAVGVVFGLYPARKASLLNPIDALRFE